MEIGWKEDAANLNPRAVGRLVECEGAGLPLPQALREDMEHLFGTGLARVRLHEQSRAAQALGMAAFACGTYVHLAPAAPDPRTPAGRGLVAHELTHVLQQANGAVGAPAGDHGGPVVIADPELERQADRMASVAAAGRFERPNFLRFDRGCDGPVPTAVLQPKVTINALRADRPATFDEMNTALRDNSNLGGMYISTSGLSANQKAEVFDLLHDWAGRPRKPVRPRKSLDLIFRDWFELAQALVGQVRSNTNKMYENAMARDVLKSGYIQTKLTAAVLKLKVYVDGLKARRGDANAANIVDRLKQGKGRYGTYYGHKWVLTKLGQKSIYEALYDLSKGEKAVGKLASFLADFAYVHQRLVAPDTKTLFDETTAKGKEFNEGRGGTYWGIDEGSKWAQDVRAHDEPVGAGPSATTALTLGTLEQLARNGSINNADHSGMLEAVAWGLFAFWNSVEHDTLWAWKASIHTFHEVMWVAAEYGVPYQLHKYPNDVPPNIEGWY